MIYEDCFKGRFPLSGYDYFRQSNYLSLFLFNLSYRIFSLWWVVYPSPFTQIYTIDWAAGAPWQNLNNAIGKILQPEIKHKSLWCTTVIVIVVYKIVIKLNNAFCMYDVSWLCHRCGDILMGSPLVCIISHSPPLSFLMVIHQQHDSFHLIFLLVEIF